MITAAVLVSGAAAGPVRAGNRTLVHAGVGAGWCGGAAVPPYHDVFLPFTGGVLNAELERYVAGKRSVSLLVRCAEYDKGALFSSYARSVTAYAGAALNWKLILPGRGLTLSSGPVMLYGYEKVAWHTLEFSLFASGEADAAAGTDRFHLLVLGYRCVFEKRFGNWVVAWSVDPGYDIILARQRSGGWNSREEDGKTGPARGGTGNGYVRSGISLGYAL